MARVAFLGTGLMGSAMVEAMVRRGDSVVAWNRTLERARPLEGIGARVAATPAAAAAGADRVHLVLSDDAAVDAVLAQARPAIAPGTLVVDHSTVSPAGTVIRFRACEEAGVGFLHAPVFMSRQSQPALRTQALNCDPDIGPHLQKDSHKGCLCRLTTT